MADSPTERRPRTPLPRGQEPGKPPARRPGTPAPTGRMPRLPGGRTFWIVVLSLLAINYLSVALFAPGKAKSVTIPYTAPSGAPGFLQQVEKGNVAKVKTQGTSMEGEFKSEVKYPDDKADAVKNFETEIPSFVLTAPADLNKLLEDKKVDVLSVPINDGRGFLTNLILGFGPVILLVVLFVWLSRRAAGGQMGAIGNFGRSRARRVEGGDQRVTFKDVAGIDEAKGELTEVVDFLRNPEKYQKLGGRIPRGVLL